MSSTHRQLNQKSISLKALTAQLRQFPREPATLSRRIALCQQTLELVERKKESKVWAQLHFELGLCLAQAQSGDLAENLEQAIEHYQAVLEVYKPESFFLEWVDSMYNLALLYERRRRDDREHNLEQAIRLHEEILEADRFRAPSAEQARSHTVLGRLYFLHTKGDRAENLEAAIRHCQQALEVWTRDKHVVRWAEIQDLLGILHRRRLCDNPAENLEKSLHYHQNALEALEPVREAYAVDWARIQHNLGTTWFHRTSGNRADNLEEAIRHFEEASTVRTRDTYPSDWACTQHDLAVAYIERQRGDRKKYLQHAVELLEAVSDFYEHEANPVGKAITQSTLGNAYLRSVYGERAENIERAIQYYKEALEEGNWGYYAQDRAMTQHNLAVAYSERLLEERVGNLGKAVKYSRAALRTIDRRDLIKWALVQTDMVDILWKLANLERQRNRERATTLMEDAIIYGEEVVSAFKGQAPSHRSALAHYNLGNAYGDRLWGRRAGNQDKAIEHYERALDFYTAQNFPARWADTHNNLGVTYWERVHGKRADNIEHAIGHFNQALDIHTPDAFPVGVRRAGRNLGNLYFEEQRWQDAVEPYQRALEATEKLYQSSLLRISKEVELSETADLYRRTAYALARSGDLEEAVVAVERGRARLLSETLQRDHADLEALKNTHPDLYQRYRQTISEIADLMRMELRSKARSPVVDLAAEMRDAHYKMGQVIKAIRQIPTYGNFLALPGFDDVVKAVQTGMPLVYIVVAPAGGLALIVHHGGVENVWLNNLTGTALLERVQRWFAFYTVNLEASRAYERAEIIIDFLRVPEREKRVALGPLISARISAQWAWFNVLDDTTRWLWDVLMGSLITTLQEMGYQNATLIPTSLLAFLPLHAAWCPSDDGSSCHYVLDDVTFAYAPSACALTYAHQAASAALGENLFAVDNPDGSLRYSAQEVAAVARHFSEPWKARHDRATRNTALDALLQCDVYHFSCHGNNAWREPLASTLWLAYRQRLTVRDLLAMPREHKARLAFLSACETGLIGTDLPDEVVGLASGFLQAGTAGVVSTLWSVADESTALLAAQFYENWKKQRMEPLRALVEAQKWLRDEADDGYWSHPYYWAGFTLTGV